MKTILIGKTQFEITKPDPEVLKSKGLTDSDLAYILKHPKGDPEKDLWLCRNIPNPAMLFAIGYRGQSRREWFTDKSGELKHA